MSWTYWWTGSPQWLTLRSRSSSILVYRQASKSCCTTAKSWLIMWTWKQRGFRTTAKSNWRSANVGTVHTATVSTDSLLITCHGIFFHCDGSWFYHEKLQSKRAWLMTLKGRVLRLLLWRGSEMIHSWWRIKILRLFNGVDCLIQAKPLSSMKLKPKQHRCEPIIE